MLFLERVGIRADIDQIHKFTSEDHLLRASEFFEHASVMLDELATPILDHINPILENYSGRWNPMGFMVLPLGSHEELGVLRLHIWPRGLRKLTPKGEPIHNHAWHLASRILIGVYSDDIYAIRGSESYLADEDQRREQGLMRVFSIGFGDTGGTLETDGLCIRVVLDEHREVNAGEHHSIEQGVFHRTTIAHDKFVATLVFDSPTLASSKSKILIDGPAHPITEQREPITAEDIVTVRNQF